MGFCEEFIKREESTVSNDDEMLKTFDGIIPEEFFSCFFAFYNGIKVGNRELVTYNLSEMEKIISNINAPDVSRLAYISLVHCFSKYLTEEYVESHFEDFPESVGEAFAVVADIVDKHFENLCLSKNNSEYFKYESLRIVKSEFSNPCLSVSMLADRLGISASYLSRYFKEKTGQTLFSYIDDTRISEAKKLLAETDMPVKDIVKSVGYNDINNFNRKFKSKTGQTPSSYRK